MERERRGVERRGEEMRGEEREKGIDRSHLAVLSLLDLSIKNILREAPSWRTGWPWMPQEKKTDTL